eukprot:CAMPEP_0178386826 /NCGR_PEP_ID=MMETSP0689_2-20121128/8761_1 /TAXON_ID=160604 /ORGANISM="Amphidinium massartii, Strain CS-259" /LENGTH=136 /DNA_ID=CAMNT_0020007177 /DNA_START=58 /DNA_END=465 /DNA_ORIENTATION=-
MSSWQQAIANDLWKGKRRETVTVMNGNQQKNHRTGRDDPDEERWLCERCGASMPGGYRRCDKCGALRPDQRNTRLEMRAKDGEIGRGGGFLQRDTGDDRREWNSDVDEFGRKKRKAKASAAVPTDKRQAALQRLQQ